MHVSVHCVEFYFKNGSCVRQEVEDHKKLEIPDGVVKYRFFERHVIDLPRLNVAPEEYFEFYDFIYINTKT